MFKYGLILFFFFSSISVHAQYTKTIDSKSLPQFFKLLEGSYSNCDVTIGSVNGIGAVNLGNPTGVGGLGAPKFDQFSFNINVSGSRDFQIGNMKSITVETANFNDFLFRIEWKNRVTNQGTVSAEIQFLYSFTKEKYETNFINNTYSVFKIFWWTELDLAKKEALKNQVLTLFKQDIANREADLNYKKSHYFSYDNLEVMNDDIGDLSWHDAVDIAGKIKDRWRLPTKDELTSLHANQDPSWAFKSKVYWSSTEKEKTVWGKSFINGGEGFTSYDEIFSVRLVRFSQTWLDEQKRQDSIRITKIREQEVRQRWLDSIAVVEKRIKDSINLVNIRIQDSIREARLAEERVALEYARRFQDSIRAEEYKAAAIIERRRTAKQNIRLNYWGFGYGMNKLGSTQDISSTAAWQFITNPDLSNNSKPVDGTAYGFNILFARRLVSILGIDIMWSEYKDGSYKTSSEANSTSTSQLKYALLKNSYYSIGPVLTLPFSKCNLDVKYLYAYSRSKMSDPTTGSGSDATKYTVNTKGTILSGGFRFPIGKGERLSNNKISLGQLGLYYEMFKFNYEYPFGNLPSYNTAFVLRYINSIN